MIRPMTCLGAAACALAAALTLVACASAPDATPPAPPRPVIDKPGARVVTLTERDNGADVLLTTTQELAVSLPIRVVDGLDWSLVDLAPGVLTASGPTFERAQRNLNPTEAAGMTQFRLKPQAPGEVTLRFDLRRRYSLEAPARTVTYRVTVK